MTNPSPFASPPSVVSRLAAQPKLLGALAIVLLCAILGVGAFAASQVGAPGQTLASFCGDLTHQKYADAYGLLSGGAQAQTRQDQWVQDQQLHDQIDGPVKTCSAGPTSGGWLTFIHSGSAATVQLSRTKAYTGEVVLVHQSNGWRVDQIDPKLQGTDLGPLQVAKQFCEALASQDFTLAYADLSARMHASVTEADFAKTYTQSLTAANAKVDGCVPSAQGYSVQGATAGLQMGIQLLVPTASGSSTVAVPFHFALIRESAGWKIDQITASGQ